MAPPCGGVGFHHGLLSSLLDPRGEEAVSSSREAASDRSIRRWVVATVLLDRGVALPFHGDGGVGWSSWSAAPRGTPNCIRGDERRHDSQVRSGGGGAVVVPFRYIGMVEVGREEEEEARRAGDGGGVCGTVRGEVESRCTMYCCIWSCKWYNAALTEVNASVTARSFWERCLSHWGTCFRSRSSMIVGREGSHLVLYCETLLLLLPFFFFFRCGCS